MLHILDVLLLRTEFLVMTAMCSIRSGYYNKKLYLLLTG